MSRSARVATVVLSALALCALAAPLFEAVLGVDHEQPALALAGCAAGWPHVLGCDDLGRDLFTRLLFGARVSLLVGFFAAALSTLLGTFAGALAGWRGGIVDAAVMRFVDAMLAIPILPLLLLVSAMAIGHDSGSGASAALKLVVILALFGWMGVARIARAEVMRLRSLDFVVAARAAGANPVRVLLRHVLPNATAPLIVATAIDVGRNILAEAALSFLGLGVQPPVPSWGNMLRHAEEAIHTAPGLAFWPGLCILATVICAHVLGDALRAALDPRSARSTP